jgi:hypothetical protein
MGFRLVDEVSANPLPHLHLRHRRLSPMDLRCHGMAVHSSHTVPLNAQRPVLHDRHMATNPNTHPPQRPPHLPTRLRRLHGQSRSRRPHHRTTRPTPRVSPPPRPPQPSSSLLVLPLQENQSETTRHPLPTIPQMVGGAPKLQKPRPKQHHFPPVFLSRFRVS